MPNQFIDLEAQVDSDDELSYDSDGNSSSDFIDNAPYGGVRDPLPPTPSTPSSSSLPPASSPAPPPESSRRLAQLVGQIQEKYVERSFLEMGHVQEPKVQPEAENPAYDRTLVLHTEDWRLWHIKCKPLQEYFLVYELMMMHCDLKDELQSVFYSPRNIGFLYLEAQFFKTGLRSLREVLRAFCDIRTSSLALVPEADLRNCLYIINTNNDPVFAPRKWVQVKRGLYKGDIGLVCDTFHGAGSACGVKIWVVPRLGLTYEDCSSSSSSKRKRRSPCPPSEHFDCESCMQLEGSLEVGKFMYSYKSWSFEYGLQVKAFNPSSLSPAREMPTSVYSLFMEAQKLAGDRFLFEEATMPLPSCWRFEPGESVTVHGTDGKAYCGTVSAAPEGNTCEVNVVSKGLQVVPVRNLEKGIILGEYIKVLVGVHVGKMGFVVAQSGAHLGVCVGAHMNGVDFLVHANSVKLSTPEFTTSVMPWINVEVTLLPQPFSGWSGVVKNVIVDARQSLCLGVQLLDGQSIEVGYYDPLLDYSPLQEDQLLEFGVNPSIHAMCTGPVPWIGVKVDFIDGNYKGEYGVVQGVDRYKTDVEKKSGLMLMLERYTFAALGSNRLVKVDYNDVRYCKTKLFLCNVYPPSEKQSFYLPNSPSEDESQTFSVPSDVSTPMPSTQMVSTPMPTEWEKWTIFTGPWSATYNYSPHSPMPSMFLLPSPPAPSSLLLLPAKPLEENIFGNAWILHPGLAGIEIAVDLKPDASLGSFGKKSPVYVKRFSDSNGIFQLMSGQTIVPWQLVVPFHDRPKPATEKRLMVVAQNLLHHIGKLVRHIHHFYKNERTEKNHLLLLTTVERPGLAEEIGHEHLEMHPDDLEFVKETPAERKISKGLLRDLRMEFSYSPVETRPRMTDLNGILTF
ncbi:hypothetical protein BT96DRAFT_1001952 [Gymnopus androsaceus JB14]|uniref:NGN domain-containing protein n=1 Tax=Gymnopus androsaceus JB14 TaxID=1447944 RepID=A0A6A4H0A1_9AGAR|nr:hypothetical protein BT96DRAFT_1001952 [Gymnopus androsaceus JB14]